jgi:hypothetical protein
VPVIADPPCATSVKVELVMVDELIEVLNVAVIVELRATPVLALTGVTAVTVGAGAAAVVNDQL